MSKPTIVILEGPDNIGKTYLAKQLSEQLNYQYHHFGPSKDLQAGKSTFFDNFHSTIDEDAIFDRSPFGEFVYGKFRGYDPYTWLTEAKQRILHISKYVNIMFIVLYADATTLARYNILPKIDEKVAYQKAEKMRPISTDFVNLLHRFYGTGMRRLLVDCNNYSTLDQRNIMITGWIKDTANRIVISPFSVKQNMYSASDGMQSKLYTCTKFATCSLAKQHIYDSGYKDVWEQPCLSSGSTLPRYVFVGEAPGNCNLSNYGLPFYGDASGTLLHRALQHYDILPSEVYITNIVHCSPKGHHIANAGDVSKFACVRNLSIELSSIHAPIIALGKTADNMLTKLGIEHSHIYHPAYYIRNGYPLGFIKQLKEVL